MNAPASFSWKAVANFRAQFLKSTMPPAADSTRSQNPETAAAVAAVNGAAGTKRKRRSRGRTTAARARAKLAAAAANAADPAAAATADASEDQPPPPLRPFDPAADCDDLAFDPAAHRWTAQSIPAALEKYWRHRHSLFARFDDPAGVLLDEEGWWSVTPEQVAAHIARRVQSAGIPAPAAAAAGRLTVVDAFCGAGGNAIQFALAGFSVIAVDVDRVKLLCAIHNAKVYNAADNITFFHGDFMKLADRITADVVFLSPPWGGPTYLNHEVYDIKEMMPIDGEELFKAARRISKNIMYYVPRNCDTQQLAQLCVGDCGTGGECELEEVYLNDRAKVLMAYYGALVNRAVGNVALNDNHSSADDDNNDDDDDDKVPSELRH
ncbi:Trimethylguanosine synthase [Entophlyctis sp. JEL0112]|nr:Trimethylguanosine synthase [Entophlyctis sp. JEL0112]